MYCFCRHSENFEQREQQTGKMALSLIPVFLGFDSVTGFPVSVSKYLNKSIIKVINLDGFE